MNGDQYEVGDINKAPHYQRNNIIDLAHRICWRYKHSNDPQHSSTYTFNDRTLMQFAEAIRAEALEEAAKLCLQTGIKHPQQTGQEACALAIRGLK